MTFLPHGLLCLPARLAYYSFVGVAKTEYSGGTSIVFSWFLVPLLASLLKMDWRRKSDGRNLGGIKQIQLRFTHKCFLFDREEMDHHLSWRILQHVYRPAWSPTADQFNTCLSARHATVWLVQSNVQYGASCCFMLLLLGCQFGTQPQRFKWDTGFID